jgi:hypothetical protein
MAQYDVLSFLGPHAGVDAFRHAASRRRQIVLTGCRFRYPQPGAAKNVTSGCARHGTKLRRCSNHCHDVLMIVRRGANTEDAIQIENDAVGGTGSSK